MSAIRIDADVLFRAVTAYEYKLLAYYLDLRTGEVVSRTLTPGEVHEPPPGPRVAPLPLLGGDLSTRKEDSPFGPPPVSKKVDLFKDDGPKSEAPFKGGFWKREHEKKVNPFGEGEFRRESSVKKLAEMFGEAPPEAHPTTPAGQPPAAGPAPTATPHAGSSAAVPAATPHAGSPAAAPAPPTSGEAAPYAPKVDPSQPLQRIPPANLEQHLLWARTFARECGDPKIREQVAHTLSGAKSLAPFERALRNYQRLGQQWQNYYRKQALHYAEAWLKAMPVQWEIVEPQGPGGRG